MFRHVQVELFLTVKNSIHAKFVKSTRKSQQVPGTKDIQQF